MSDWSGFDARVTLKDFAVQLAMLREVFQKCVGPTCMYYYKGGHRSIDLNRDCEVKYHQYVRQSSRGNTDPNLKVRPVWFVGNPQNWGKMLLERMHTNEQNIYCMTLFNQLIFCLENDININDVDKVLRLL